MQAPSGYQGYAPGTAPEELREEVRHAQYLGWYGLFVRSGERFGHSAALLMAIASRETAMGRSASLDGWTGDGGHGHGIMQIDDRWHPQFVAAHADDDHAANIDYAASLLRDEMRRFGDVGVAVSAYNAGSGNVRRALRAGQHPDSVTTGGDYGRDVWARAVAMAAACYPNPAPSAANGLTASGLAASGLAASGLAVLGAAPLAGAHAACPGEDGGTGDGTAGDVYARYDGAAGIPAGQLALAFGLAAFSTTLVYRFSR